MSAKINTGVELRTIYVSNKPINMNN